MRKLGQFFSLAVTAGILLLSSCSQQDGQTLGPSAQEASRNESGLTVQIAPGVRKRDGVTIINVPEALLPTGGKISAQSLSPQAVVGAGEQGQVVLQFSRGEEIAYENIDGYAVTSGDVLLALSKNMSTYAGEYQNYKTSIDPEPAAAPGLETTTLKPQAHIGTQGYVCVFQFIRCWAGYTNTPNWPNAVVKYTISGANSTEMDTINATIGNWNAIASNKPKWEPGTGGTTIRVVNSIPFGPCGFAPVGYSQQRLVPLLLLSRVGNCFTPGLILHEMGHVVGLNHEHQRCDRDTFIDLNYSWWEFLNYNKLCAMGQHQDPYDYSSLMHYGGNIFAKASRPNGRWVGNPNSLGGNTLTPTDISHGLRVLYPLTP